jgi:hypothetical protein
MTKRDLTAETAEDKFNVEAEARRRGIEPYQVRATGAVNDRLMADLVSDFRRPISQSSSMIPPTREPPKPRGTGWVDSAPVKPPSGVDHIDAIAESFARRERAVRVQQEMELAEIERRMDRRNPYKAKTEFDHLKRYD